MRIDHLALDGRDNNRAHLLPKHLLKVLYSPPQANCIHIRIGAVGSSIDMATPILFHLGHTHFPLRAARARMVLRPQAANKLLTMTGKNFAQIVEKVRLDRSSPRLWQKAKSVKARAYKGAALNLATLNLRVGGGCPSLPQSRDRVSLNLVFLHIAAIQLASCARFEPVNNCISCFLRHLFLNPVAGV